MAAVSRQPSAFSAAMSNAHALEITLSHSGFLILSSPVSRKPLTADC
jgi:hypothetical protein